MINATNTLSDSVNFLKKADQMFIDYYNSPLGMIECAASDKGLRHVIFCGDDIKPTSANPITRMCIAQLNQYFNEKLLTFSVPLDPIGTEFQKQVWQQLSRIPYGQTCSYLDIAKKVNCPKGSQAVGGANGRNPISIIVPCHRVIASSGALTGYAGGIERKHWLLEHEGIKVAQQQVNKPLKLDNVIQTRQEKTQFLR